MRLGEGKRKRKIFLTLLHSDYLILNLQPPNKDHGVILADIRLHYSGLGGIRNYVYGDSSFSRQRA